MKFVRRKLAVECKPNDRHAWHKPHALRLPRRFYGGSCAAISSHGTERRFTHAGRPSPHSADCPARCIRRRRLFSRTVRNPMRRLVLAATFAVATVSGACAEAGSWYRCMFGGPLLGDCSHNCYCYEGECGGCDPCCYDNCFRCCPEPNYLIQPCLPRPTGCWTKAAATCCTPASPSCYGSAASGCCESLGPSCCAPVAR